MNGLRRLVVEAHRRSLWQVLSVYLVASWAVYQFIGEVTNRMALPDWVPGFAFVLILIGLPIVLATTIVQEGPPQLRPVSAEPIDPTLLPMDMPAEPEPVRKRDLLFTWKKAILGGVAAFLLLTITAAGYMGMRNAGIGPFGSLLAKGDLQNRERILIAEFAPLNGDTMLATAVTEAFRVDFGQSSAVTVVEPSHVRTVLQRMSRDVKARVDAELAHEIAVRDNIRTYLVGELSQPGGKFVVSGKLVATRDNRTLATYRETAGDSSEIIDAVDRLSRKLRDKIGESLRTIRAEKPLEAVSTPSLEALEKYTEAAILIDTDRNYVAGISLLEDAIALDSAFAMAWRKLAVAYSNSGSGRAKVVHAASRAYQFRDRLTDVERYAAAGYYYSSVTQDYTKSINAYTLLEQRDPTWVPNNLGLDFTRVREFEKAAAAFERAISRDSTLSVAYSNLAATLAQLGRYDESLEMLALYKKKFTNVGPAHAVGSWVEASRGNWSAAEKEASALLESNRQSPLARNLGNTRLRQVRLAQGRLAEAERHLREAVAANEERGIVSTPLTASLETARTSWSVRGDPKRALNELEAAFRQHPLEKIPALDRPYLSAAGMFALLGKVDRARALVTEFERAVPNELRGNDAPARAEINAAIALTERRFEDAIPLWRTASKFGPCETCLDVVIGLTFESAGQPDSAIARYERFVSTEGYTSISDKVYELGPTYERLADLYAMKGDSKKAVLYAAKFVELWKDADAELQPRVEAKRKLIQRMNTPG